MQRGTTRAHLLARAAALGYVGAFALPTDDVHAAQREPPIEIVLHVPYPVTGPREIQASDRASRSYRAIAARASPPITDTMAAMVEAALWTGADLKVTRTSRAAAHALAPQGPGRSDPKHALPDLVLAGDDVLRASLAAATKATNGGAPTVVEPIAEMPYVLVCITAQCRSLAAQTPGHRQLSALRLRSIGTAGELGGSTIAGRAWTALTRSHPLLVSYAGGNGIVGDLVAERIESAFLALPLALHHLGHAKLHALGIASEHRFVGLPDLPTLAEGGTPLVFESWFAVFRTARLPAAMTQRVQAALRAYRTEETSRSELHRIGLLPSSATPAQVAGRIDVEQLRLSKPAP